MALGLGCWQSPLWNLVHRAVLHHVEYLDGTSVLRIWLLVCGLVAAAHRVCRSVSGCDIHASVC